MRLFSLVYLSHLGDITSSLDAAMTTMLSPSGADFLGYWQTALHNICLVWADIQIC